MRRMITGVKTASRSGVVDRSHTYGPRQMAFESLEGRCMLTSSFPHVIPRSPDILPPSANFGSSVALGDRFAVVGAPNDGVGHSGSAFVYALRTEASTENWVNVGKLDLNGDAGEDDLFGFSVAVSHTIDERTTIVVGAWLRDEATGAVYVFELSQSGDVQSMSQLPLPNGGQAGMAFGYSVAIDRDRDTIVVGAPSSQIRGKMTGAAFVYRSDPLARSDRQEWTQTQTLVASDADFLDDFGTSVAIDDGTIAVGANRDDDKGPDAGAVYTFTMNGSKWAQQQKLTAPDGHAGDCFGYSVALSGDTLVAGAFLHDHIARDAGAAYVFRFNSPNGVGWTQLQEITPTEVRDGAKFGQRVAISNDRKILVAVPEADVNAASVRAVGVSTSIRDAGKAFLYKPVWVEDKLEWVEADSFEFVAPDPSTNDKYGFGVAVSEVTVLIGAPFVDNSVDTGSAFFYTDPPVLDISPTIVCGSTTILTMDNLNLITDSAPEKTIYELLDLRLHGELLLDDTVLSSRPNTPFTFSQADINSGRVRYAHQAYDTQPRTEPDFFSFTATADDIFMDSGDDVFPRTAKLEFVNEPPKLGDIESVPLPYLEGTAPTAITNTITVGDDCGMIAGAAVAIATGYKPTADKLRFDDTDKIVSDWDEATGTLTLTGKATAEEYEQALRKITFSSGRNVAAAADDVDSIQLPTTLEVLTASSEGKSVILGDVTFTQFSYTWTGNSPSASQVTVSSPDGVGLRFTGPFFDLPDEEVSTATIEYTVTGKDISRVTLAGNPSLLGASAGESRVTETVTPGTQLVIFNIKPGEPPLMIEDARQITPSDTLVVATTIALESLDSEKEEPVALSVIEQRFLAEETRTIEFVVVDDDEAPSNTVSRQIIVRDSTDPGTRVADPGSANTRFAAARNAARTRLLFTFSQSSLRTSVDQISNPVHDLPEAKNKQPSLRASPAIPLAESSESASDDQPRQVQIAEMSEHDVDVTLAGGDLEQPIEEFDYLDS